MSFPSTDLPTLTGDSNRDTESVRKAILDLLDKINQVVDSNVIISGTNQYGVFSKYPDGTMVQRGRTATLTSSVAAGAIFSSPQTPVTFPVQYYSTPDIYPSVIEGLSQGFGSNYFAPTITGFQVRLYGPTNVSTGIVTWIAIGRWKA